VSRLLEFLGPYSHGATGRSQFKDHLERYVRALSADCYFDFKTTSRYIGVSEACIKSRKHIKKGTDISYLCGFLVHLTKKEEKALKRVRRDFSIILSNRTGRAMLLLGPARFINHDCDANAELCPAGKNLVKVVAVRDIKIGEEITVTYSDHYFGENNAECLCATCEVSRHGKLTSS
jgi:histone-lysine N-methyltransferase SUV420H